jgi:hypothetical protein
MSKEQELHQKGLDSLNAIIDAMDRYNRYAQMDVFSGATTPEEEYIQDHRNEALTNTALLAAVTGLAAKKWNKPATALAALGFYPGIFNNTIKQPTFIGDISRLAGDNTEQADRYTRYNTPGQGSLDLIDLGLQFHPASWIPATVIDTAQAAFPDLNKNDTLNTLRHVYGDVSITQPIRSLLDMQYNTNRGKFDKKFYQRKWEDYKQNMKVTPWYAKPGITGVALGDALIRSFYADHLEDY